MYYVWFMVTMICAYYTWPCIIFTMFGFVTFSHDLWVILMLFHASLASSVTRMRPTGPSVLAAHTRILALDDVALGPMGGQKPMIHRFNIWDRNRVQDLDAAISAACGTLELVPRYWSKGHKRLSNDHRMHRVGQNLRDSFWDDRFPYGSLFECLSGVHKPGPSAISAKEQKRPSVEKATERQYDLCEAV